MKKSLVSLLISIFAFSTLVFAGFNDVSYDHENGEAIFWLQMNEVIEGYSDGTFKPDKQVNRAEFLKMLYETVGMTGQDVALKFPDVPEGVWYTDYVKEAYATGVVNGYPDGTFRPGDSINFVEALKIVMDGFFPAEENDPFYNQEYFSCGHDIFSYEGLDESAWYNRYLRVAESLCIIDFDHSALGDEEYFPGNFITRADMAELLYRAKAIRDSNKNEDSGLYFKYESGITPNDILRDPNEFDLMGIKVGDKVGDMDVVEVGPAIGNGERTKYNGEIKFGGEVTVTGVYNYFGEDSPFVGDSVCIEKLDAESDLKIPTPSIAYKPNWFCFSNKEFAQSHFEEQSTGTATVVIDKYQSRYAETEIWDLAELVEVVEFEKTGELSPTGALYLSSTVFDEGQKIPGKYTCDGEDVSPPLRISGVPDVAESLVLIVDDPDAPGGTWNHWTVWNIDPDITEIAEDSLPSGAREGVTSFGSAGYGGPCPPSGTHRYFFELTALDAMLALPEGATKEDLEAAMESHVVEGVLFTGKYTFEQ